MIWRLLEARDQLLFAKMESGGRQLKANPHEKANFLSLLFFGWTIPLFKQTYGKILDASDVCKPCTSDQSRILGDRLNRYKKCSLQNRNWKFDGSDFVENGVKNVKIIQNHHYCKL